MSNATAPLRRKIHSARDLQSVVRTMKTLAASSIGQYEKSIRALGDYYHAVELGLGVCFRKGQLQPPKTPFQAGKKEHTIGAIVFGSDQGLVGQFNDEIADFALKTLKDLRPPLQVWAVGERVSGRLSDHGVTLVDLFPVPSSVKGITPLIGQILEKCDVQELHLFYNQPASAAVYTPISQRLLPLDQIWYDQVCGIAWPSKNLPEVVGDETKTLRALIGEYLFVSLFKACAESLASENASRLAAMQRADKNIDELTEELNARFHRLRQSGIDEELFDVVAGFEEMSKVT